MAGIMINLPVRKLPVKKGEHRMYPHFNCKRILTEDIFAGSGTRFSAWQPGSCAGKEEV